MGFPHREPLWPAYNPIAGCTQAPVSRGTTFGCWLAGCRLFSAFRSLLSPLVDACRCRAHRENPVQARAQPTFA
jgi:hypothetical protein